MADDREFVAERRLLTESLPDREGLYNFFIDNAETAGLHQLAERLKFEVRHGPSTWDNPRTNAEEHVVRVAYHLGEFVTDAHSGRSLGCHHGLCDVSSRDPRAEQIANATAMEQIYACFGVLSLRELVRPVTVRGPLGQATGLRLATPIGFVLNERRFMARSDHYDINFSAEWPDFGPASLRLD